MTVEGSAPPGRSFVGSPGPWNVRGMVRVCVGICVFFVFCGFFLGQTVTIFNYIRVGGLYA